MPVTRRVRGNTRFVGKYVTIARLTPTFLNILLIFKLDFVFIINTIYMPKTIQIGPFLKKL